MLHVTLSFLTQTQALSDLMMKYDSGSQKTAEAKYSISLKTFVIGSSQSGWSSMCLSDWNDALAKASGSLVSHLCSRWETGPKCTKFGRISHLAWAQGISPSTLETEIGPMQNLQSE